jgi:cyanophycinase-like exopeptidase
MRSVAYDFSSNTARADALFASTLQRTDEPSAEQVVQAIAAAIRVFGASGCAARVAQAYGEHPETAVLRMRWARAAVVGVSGGARLGPVYPAVPAQRTRAHACCAA